MPSRWQRLPINKALSTISSCVYAIYADNKLVYVGSTNNLYVRFAKHKQIGAPWGAKDVFLKVSKNRRYGEHAMRELRLIAKLNPERNKAHRVGLGKPWVPWEGRVTQDEYEWLATKAA